MNKLAETTNKEKINLIFKSDLTKIFQCDMCHNDKIKTTKSSIYCMSLPVDRKCSLAAAIKQSNNDMILNEKSCQGTTCVSTRIKTKFSKLPYVFILRLKPSLDMESKVTYDSTLDLKEYILEGLGKTNTEYKLVSVICYMGNARGGHCMNKI